MQKLENLFHDLERQGWAFADEVTPENLSRELFLECQKSWEDGLFTEASIGRGTEKNRHSEIRGDSILWLNSGQESGAPQKFLQWAEDLQKNLNQRYYLGLRSNEFHFARYPTGKGYQKHLDQHRGTPHRQISLVLYLNPQWSEQDGGELCLYSTDDDSILIQKVRPQGGRLVLFRSDLVPHEVLPCFQTRWSLTGWFRTDS